MQIVTSEEINQEKYCVFPFRNLLTWNRVTGKADTFILIRKLRMDESIYYCNSFDTLIPVTISIRRSYSTMANGPIWASPTEFVTGESTLQISYPYVSHSDTIVTCTSPGDLKWISMGLRLPEKTTIEEIIVCYQVSNCKSFIAQIRL